MRLQNEDEMNSPIGMALSDWDLNSEIESELAENIQAAFESMEQKDLIYKGSLRSKNLDYAIRHVANQPQQLMAHVKRFYLAMLCRSESKVQGALIDLMIVLRYKGNPLLIRLINEAAVLLGTSLCDQLKSIAQNKTANGILLLDVSCSILINGRSLPATYKKKDSAK
jgi:hypothetical protein